MRKTQEKQLTHYLVQYVVQEFYKLGLSMPLIAELTHTSIRDVRSHMKCLGGVDAFPERPKEDQVYPAAFIRYARLMERTKEGLDSANEAHQEQEAVVCEYLAQFLGVESILEHARGSAEAVRQLCQYGDRSVRHVRQLFAIFNHWKRAPVSIKDDAWWQIGWISSLLDGGAPASIEEAKRRLAQHVVSEGRKFIRSCWDKIPTEFLDEELSKLTPIERRIFNAVVNAETPDAAFKEMSGQLTLSRERIRQLYGVAHRKLHTALYRKGYGAALHLTSQDLLQSRINMIGDTEAQKKIRVALSPTDPAIFLELIPTMERVSLGTYDRLRNLGIVFVGELAQWTPEALLRRGRFGHKGLTEISVILIERGMRLGLVYEESYRRVLEERRRNPEIQRQLKSFDWPLNQVSPELVVPSVPE